MALYYRGNDFRFLSEVQKDLYKTSYQKVQIFFPDVIPDDYDDFYRETPAGRLLENSTPHEIEANVVFEAPESEWTKAGIEEQRFLTVSFSRKLLEEADHPFPVAGCLIEVEGSVYYFTERRYKYYHASTRNWHTLVFKAVEHNNSNLPDEATRVGDVEVFPETSPAEVSWE